MSLNISHVRAPVPVYLGKIAACQYWLTDILLSVPTMKDKNLTVCVVSSSELTRKSAQCRLAQELKICRQTQHIHPWAVRSHTRTDTHPADSWINLCVGDSRGTEHIVRAGLFEGLKQSSQSSNVNSAPQLAAHLCPVDCQCQQIVLNQDEVLLAFISISLDHICGCNVSDPETWYLVFVWLHKKAFSVPSALKSGLKKVLMT